MIKVFFSTVFEAIAFCFTASMLSLLFKTALLLPLSLTYSPTLIVLFSLRLMFAKYANEPLREEALKLRGQLDDANRVIKHFTDSHHIESDINKFSV